MPYTPHGRSLLGLDKRQAERDAYNALVHLDMRCAYVNETEFYRYTADPGIRRRWAHLCVGRAVWSEDHYRIVDIYGREVAECWYVHPDGLFGYHLPTLRQVLDSAAEAVALANAERREAA